MGATSTSSVNAAGLMLIADAASSSKVSRFVRSQARALLRAHGPLLAAVESGDRHELEDAALNLFVIASQVCGRMGGELRRIAAPSVPKSRKARARAR